MSEPSRRRRPLRPWLALLLATPLLLGSSAPASGLALIHSHEGEGLHQHALSVESAHVHQASGQGHAQGHSHGHDAQSDTGEGHGTEGPAAPGVLLERPELAWPRPTEPRVCLDVLDWAHAVLRTPCGHPSQANRSTLGRPPSVRQSGWLRGTGALAVLRTSHALLI